MRVCYAYFEEFGVILLALAYAKNEQLDLKPVDRKTVRQLLQDQHDMLEKLSRSKEDKP
jgi:hypothetical protein